MPSYVLHNTHCEFFAYLSNWFTTDPKGTMTFFLYRKSYNVITSIVNRFSGLCASATFLELILWMARYYHKCTQAFTYVSVIFVQS